MGIKSLLIGADRGNNKNSETKAATMAIEGTQILLNLSEAVPETDWLFPEPSKPRGVIVGTPANGDLLMSIDSATGRNKSSGSSDHEESEFHSGSDS